CERASRRRRSRTWARPARSRPARAGSVLEAAPDPEAAAEALVTVAGHAEASAPDRARVRAARASARVRARKRRAPKGLPRATRRVASATAAAVAAEARPRPHPQTSRAPAPSAPCAHPLAPWCTGLAAKSALAESCCTETSCAHGPRDYRNVSRFGLGWAA